MGEESRDQPYSLTAFMRLLKWSLISKMSSLGDRLGLTNGGAHGEATRLAIWTHENRDADAGTGGCHA